MRYSILKWLGRSITILPMKKLKIDERYQRRIIKKNLDAMIRDFDEDGLRVLVVCDRPDGSYDVLDGQYRLLLMWAVAAKMGYTEVACEIRHNYTLVRRAKAFDLLNAVNKMSSAAKFRAQLQANVKRFVDINGTVVKNGFTIKLNRGRPRAEENVINALGTLTAIEKRYGLQMLDSTLFVVANAFAINENGQVIRSAVRSEFLLGIAGYLFQSQIDPDQLISLLRDKDADDIWDKISKNQFRKDIPGKFIKWLHRLDKLAQKNRRYRKAS